MFCGKCGKQDQAGYEFCMNCGTKFEHSNTNNEIQVETILNPKNKMQKKVFIAVLLIAIVSIAIFIGVDLLGQDNGYVRDTTWGMNVGEVVDSEDIEPMLPYDGDGTLSYLVSDFEGLDGNESMLTYTFDSDILVSSTTAMTDDNAYKIADELKELYIKKYGDMVEDNGYKYSWETEKSVIEIVMFLDEVLMITFTDITYED